MNVTLNAIGFSLDSETRARLEKRVESVLSRFSDRVRSIQVRLEDENGPKGGVDHRCQVEAHLTYGPTMIVEARDVDAPTSLDRAARRLLRKIRRDLERRIDARRARDDRSAPPSDFRLGERDSSSTQGS